MRNLFKAVFILVFISGCFSQQLHAQMSINYLFSHDSLQGFSESAIKATAISEGIQPEDMKGYMFYKKREFIDAKYKLLKFIPTTLTLPTKSITLPTSLSSKGGSGGTMAAPCVNEGFELNSIAGWSLNLGTNTNPNANTGCIYITTPTTAVLGGTVGAMMTTPFVDGIMGAVGNSPFPGTKVVKLNDGIATGDRSVVSLSQTFPVTSTNFLYEFAYIAVNQNTFGHFCCAQPFMYVRVRDCLGNLLPCPTFSITPPNGGSCPGTGPATWSTYTVGGSVWKANATWQKYSIDLTSYISSCVTIEVSVGDCSLGGHAGYAYFDSNCNTFGITVNGTLIPAPSITVNATAPCGTTATLSAPSGLNPYDWDGPPLSGINNATTQAVTTSVAGNYTIQMTPVGVCNPIYRVVNLQFTPPVTITAVPSSTICLGNSTTLTATGALNYTWSPGGSTSSSIVVSPTTTTIYTLTATSGTCTGTFTQQVTVNGPVSVSASASPTGICTGGTSTLTASGATSYTWMPGGATGVSITVTPTTTTIYTVTGSTGAACSGTATVMVTVNSTPTVVAFSNPGSICPGNTATLTAFGATTYTWNPGGLTGAFVTVTPTVTTTYTVTGSNSGCTGTTTAMVTVNPSPTITAIATPTGICSGSSATLSASGAINYTWNPGGIIGGTITVSPTTTTNYTVTGTSGAGCAGTAFVTLSVTTTPTITASASPATICSSGATSTLSASGASSYTWMPGALNGASVVVNPGVTTTYTVVGSNGSCLGNTVTVLLTVNPSPTVTASAAPTVICSGSSSNLSALGAVTYTWNPGGLTGANVVVSPVVTTNYTVTGTAAGCTGTAVVQVSVNPTPTITIVASPTAICVGSSATITASGATNYTWAPGGATTASIVVSPASTQIYTVTGANGVCTSTQTIQLIVNPIPTVAASASPTVICAGGSSTLTGSGATTYTWMPGGLTGATVVVSPASSTTYTLTGSNGTCGSTATVALLVNPNPTVTATAAPTIICSGSSSTLTASGATSYTWMPGGMTTSTVQVSPLITTIYTVTGSNGFGCTNSATVTLSVTPTPTVTASVNPTLTCAGSPATLTASGATTYTWLPGGMTTATAVVNPTVTTTYTLTGANGGMCFNTQTVMLTVNPIPTVTAVSSPTAICSGSSATLTAGGAITYTWAPGGSTNTVIVVSPTVTTTYTVTGSNGVACTNTATVTVSVTPTPTLTAVSNPTAICVGATATLTGSGATNYTWSPGGATTSSIVVNPTVTTTYTLDGANGSCISTQTVMLTVNGLPTITAVAAPTVVCSGVTSTLTAIGALTYTWNPGGATGAVIVVSPTVNTTYTVTGTNLAGCTSSAAVSLSVNPVPSLTVSASVPSICVSGTVSLNASGATSYTWNPGGMTTGTVVVSPTITTTYTVTGATAFGCTSTQTISVVVNTLSFASAVANPTVICAGGTSTLTGSGATTYTWNPGGLNGTTVTVSPVTTTQYTVTGANGACTSTAVVSVSVNPSPTITAVAIPTAICSGASATLGATGGLSYTWNPGALNGVSVTVNPGVTTTYTVTGNNAFGCISTATVTLSVTPTPTLTASASPTAVCAGGSSTLTGTGAASYTWMPGGATTSTVVVTPTITTTYTLTGANGSCNVTQTVTLIINPNPTVTAVSNPTGICVGATATLTGSGATSYTWNPGNLSGTSVTVSPATSTNYTVLGATGTCTGITTVSLTVNPNPTVTAVAVPTAICSGATASLIASGASSYTWNPGGLTGATVNVSPTITTVYTVTGTNASGCTNTRTVSLTVNPSPTLIATSNPTSQIICAGSSVTLAVVGANTYTWNPGGVSGQTIVVSPTVSTNYTVTGTNGSGCNGSTTLSITVNPNPTVTVVASPTAICSGSSATLTGSGASSYTWNPGALNGTTVVVSPTITTTFTVNGSTNGCNGSTTVAIVVNASPVLTVTSGSITCTVSTVTLNAVSNPTTVTYAWTGPGSFTSTAQSATVNTTGTYTVIVTNTVNGCSTSTTTTVGTNTSVPTASASVTGTITCTTTTVVLIGNSGSFPVTYTWTGPGTFTSALQNPTVTVGGGYTVTVTDPNSGCSSSATINVPTNIVVPITATITNATCNGTLTNNDGKITLGNFVPGDRFDVVVGPTYTGTAVYATAANIPGSGVITSSLPNPTITTAYTVRLFSVAGCFKDTTLFLSPVDCSANNTLGVAKAITSASLNANGTYDVSYKILIKNIGPVVMNNVLITESLTATFPPPTTFTIVSSPSITSTSSSLTLNGSFDGAGQANITTAATSTLPVGASDTIVFTVRIAPNGVFGPFKNSVLAEAVSTTSLVVKDSSNTGLDVDPDNDFNPTNNNLPTVLTLTPNTVLGLAKSATVSEMLSDNTYDITYVITIKNFGNDTLHNVQITDSLNKTFPLPATYYVKSAPLASGIFTTNANFNGNSDIKLLSPVGTMAPGALETVTFVVNVAPDTCTTFVNTANAWAIGQTSIVTRDSSNAGYNMDPNGNGITNETAENIPTVVKLEGPFFIPDGFTPNGDGKNDFFVIKGLNHNVENVLTIYNRWGNKVYTKINYDNSWQGYPNVGGTLGNERLPQGTYYYILEFKGGDIKNKNGFVVLQY